MSHVAIVDLFVDSLDLLEDACRVCDLELIRDKANWKWYGNASGANRRLPDGIDPAMMGLGAAHIIRVRGARSQTYEVGVYSQEGGYRLYYDPFCGGYGLEDKAGKNLSKLKTEYGIRRATVEARKKGMAVKRTVVNGRVALVCQ